MASMKPIYTSDFQQNASGVFGKAQQNFMAMLKDKNKSKTDLKTHLTLL